MAACSQDVRQFGSGRPFRVERSCPSHPCQSCAACSFRYRSQLCGQRRRLSCKAWHVLLVLQNPRTDSVGRSGQEHGRSIPFASFRCAAEFGRDRGITDPACRSLAKLEFAALAEASHAGELSFSPTIPATIRVKQIIRKGSAGSLKITMPRMMLPAAPMPVHTAYAVPKGSDRSASAISEKLARIASAVASVGQKRVKSSEY